MHPVFKAELEEIQIYFRKITLHQKFFVVSVLSNSSWLLRNLKDVQTILLSSFRLATQILTFQPIKANFLYKVLQNYPNINEFCSSATMTN